MASTKALPVFPEPPTGYRIHIEGQAGILVPEESSTHVPDKDKQQHVFVNPIQEFNRDVSIAVIRSWSGLFDEEKKQKWQKKQDKKRDQPAGASNKNKKRKIDQVEGPDAVPAAADSDLNGDAIAEVICCTKLYEHNSDRPCSSRSQLLLQSLRRTLRLQVRLTDLTNSHVLRDSRLLDFGRFATRRSYPCFGE